MCGQNPLVRLQCPVGPKKGCGWAALGPISALGCLPSPEVISQSLLVLRTRCPSHLPGARVKGPPGFDPDKIPFSEPLCLSLPVHSSLHLLTPVLLLVIGAPFPWPAYSPTPLSRHPSSRCFSVWPQPVRGLVLKALCSKPPFLQSSVPCP